jgi:hypothetical protein
MRGDQGDTIRRRSCDPIASSLAFFIVAPDPAFAASSHSSAAGPYLQQQAQKSPSRGECEPPRTGYRSGFPDRFRFTAVTHTHGRLYCTLVGGVVNDLWLVLATALIAQRARPPRVRRVAVWGRDYPRRTDAAVTTVVTLASPVFAGFAGVAHHAPPSVSVGLSMSANSLSAPSNDRDISHRLTNRTNSE